MVHALWDIESNNLVAEYENLEEALALVLRGIERNGQQDTDSLALESEDNQGEVTLIAHGQELAALARRELGGRDHLAR
jgi:hypothetical protein